MLKKSILIYLALIFILVNLFITTSYAETIPVTNENLRKTFQKLVSSEANTENYTIRVTDTAIIATANGTDYTLNYNLSGNPTFSIEIPIQNGMSYAEFEEKTNQLLLPALGYIAVANIENIGFKDALMHFAMTYLCSSLSTPTNPYVIVDDTTSEDGVTIDRDNSSQNTIYVSEFGDKVMDYLNASFKNTQTITDSMDGVDTFQLVIQKRDLTDTSCKLVSTLRVNMNSDFSKITASSDSDSDSDSIDNALNNGTLQESGNNTINISTPPPSTQPTTNPTIQPTQNATQKPVSTSTSTPDPNREKLPQTGLSNTIYVVISLSCVLVIIFGIKTRKYKNIK